MADPAYDPKAKQWITDDTPLEFEQRVLKPSMVPPIQNEDGSYSTHRMAWGDGDGKFFAYPTIVNHQGKLQQLDDATAWRYAQETGQFREFTTPEDADAYAAGGYKNSWGRGELPKKK